MKLTDLKTFEDACTVEKLDAAKVIPDFSMMPKQDQAAMIAHAKLVIIVRAANRLVNKGKQWKPNWTNGKWDKYYAWFIMGGSSGFRFLAYGHWYSFSVVGSRLCLKSAEAAEHVGKQFTELYKEYFVID